MEEPQVAPQHYPDFTFSDKFLIEKDLNRMGVKNYIKENACKLVAFMMLLSKKSTIFYQTPKKTILTKFSRKGTRNLKS